MSATTWFIIAILGFVLAAVAFVIAIYMFIKMNIPAIIGDLSGKTVAREIEAMRKEYAASDQKRSKQHKAQQDTPYINTKKNRKGKSEKVLVDNNGSLPTEVLSTETEVLSDNVTEVLEENATEVLDEGTTVLTDKTTLLSSTEELEETIDTRVAFTVVKSEVVIHTDEVI